MSVIKNIYEDRIDFSALASNDADFAKLKTEFCLVAASLKPNGQLDFSNPDAVRQLTESLLRRDFQLKISLPPDRLCPPVPNRLNYILWIQGLLDTTDSSYEDKYNSKKRVLGLDIGTGASCIYPLLGCTQRPNWQFFGTEMDEKSLKFARENVKLNNLQNRILLLKTETGESLIPMGMINSDRIDFTMCNPPFYESKADMLTSAEAKKRPPFTACTGSESEMVTNGGEVAFVSRIIDESLMLKDRVQWYTSMLGKLLSVAIIQEKLKKVDIDNYAITEFVSGNRTRRWGIAWSLGDMRPSVMIARGPSNVQKGILPFPPEYHLLLGSEELKVSHKIDEVLSRLPLKWQWKVKSLTGIGFSQKDVWSRTARRQKDTLKPGTIAQSDSTAFGFKIHVQKLSQGMASTQVTIRWLRGHDVVLFESFCGMLKRLCCSLTTHSG